MRSKFTSLVSIKKDIMQKSERALQSANMTLKNAKEALKLSHDALSEIETPTNGYIADFIASRTLLDSQRSLIKHNEEWVAYAQEQVKLAKERLRVDMLEYEKFKYLHLEEVKKVLKAQKIKESKALDEVALMSFNRKNRTTF